MDTRAKLKEIDPPVRLAPRDRMSVTFTLDLTNDLDVPVTVIGVEHRLVLVEE